MSDIESRNKSNLNERSLLRSRSEQDLSDLIRNNKIDFNELDLSDGHINPPREFQPDSSFTLHKKDHNEIKIQENLFDESSQRQSKKQDYFISSQMQ